MATEGEIWLWPPEMTCSALHLRGHDVAQAEQRGALGEGRDAEMRGDPLRDRVVSDTVG